MDRFDFEQQIMDCWNVTKDIDTLRKQLLDMEDGMTQDDIDNYLLGLKTIYDVKFNQLFDQFERMIREGKIL